MARMDKFLAIRERIIGDFDHHREELGKFTAASSATAVSYRMVALEKTYKEFIEINEELEKITLFAELDHRDEMLIKNRQIQDRYLDLKLKIAELLPQQEINLNETFFSTTNRAFEDKETEQATPQKHWGLKLASLQLMTFDGKFEQWPEFKDMFMSAMKKYRGDDAEKLRHLKNYLRGEPREIIQHLGIQNEHYEVAWELLSQQYGNKSAIIDAYLRNFMELPTITHTTAQTIRQAITVTRSSLAAIKNLGCITDAWDPIIVFMLREKLNPELRSKWEEEIKGSNEPPKLTEFLSFLEIRHRIGVTSRRSLQKPVEIKPKPVRAFTNVEDLYSAGAVGGKQLATIEAETNPVDTFNTSAFDWEKDETDALVMLNQRNEKCGICEDQHRVFNCPLWKENSEEAYKRLVNKGLCINCLYKHNVTECISKFRCRTCNEKHNTLLHNILAVNAMLTDMQGLRLNHNYASHRKTLLATALVPVHTAQGVIILRALIDQGSTANLISEKGAQALKCKRRRITTIPMLGVGNVQTGSSSFKTFISIGSMHDVEFELTIEVYVTTQITTIPSLNSQIMDDWPHLNGLKLADTSEVGGNEIHLLIGARTFAEIIENGVIKGKANEPIAQQTKLGWIISGGCDHNSAQSETEIKQLMNVSCDHMENNVSNEDLSMLLQSFWEMEETTSVKEWSLDDRECFDYFMRTLSRGSDGKLIMRIPFISNPNAPNFLGDSLARAKQRFFQLERRFARDMKLKETYTKGIQEYFSLGHAKKVPIETHRYVIPHHAVVKENSTTTKLRTVFDASAKTTNGFSLNDRMHTGPTILEDLWAVLIRWRLGKIALTGDIEKMYRQFWVHPEDTPFLQFLWRDNPDEPLELFELQTVTFGTKAAPFMAIQGLHHIAESIEKENPIAAGIIKKNFYVDDCLDSEDTPEEAVQMKEQLSKIFAEYGLNLRKWNSNAVELMTEETVDVQLHPEKTCTALGMQWHTSTDQLTYKVALKTEKELTKRTALSQIASLFDPLGLLTPIVIRAKLFMQRLWLGQFGWDDDLPHELRPEWQAIKSSLLACAQIKIPRWIGFAKQNKHVSVHGFCDAAEKAYAAAIYLRTACSDDTVNVHLITAKSKVAPLKTVSIPRLELCSAVLLAKLLDKFLGMMKIPNIEVYAWTDSSVTLAWISTPPHMLKTFVSNRVTEIQQKIKPEHWRHIKSAMNPADCATRGQNSDEMLSSTKWWTGPAFLKEKQENWPQTPSQMVSNKNLIPEMKARVMHQQEVLQLENVLAEYSSLSRLLQITARFMRWKKDHKIFRKYKIITPIEIDRAKLNWVKYAQENCYTQEIQCLRTNKPLPSRSVLLSLNPILDNNGILRVKGRLTNSLLTYDNKFPIILPADNQFTTLIIRGAHFRTLHGGLQQTLRAIRDEFWIVRGKMAVKRVLKQCITCFRDKCQPAKQQMADLLAPQVQPNRPFSHTGVDFAGYFEVKTSTRRNAAFTKCYVALFICLTTKAIHLELVHDLSTAAFIAALRRFVARRGVPSDIYSDRGTNFIGASNDLPELWYEEHTRESQHI